MQERKTWLANYLDKVGGVIDRFLDDQAIKHGKRTLVLLGTAEIISIFTAYATGSQAVAITGVLIPGVGMGFGARRNAIIR